MQASERLLGMVMVMMSFAKSLKGDPQDQANVISILLISARIIFMQMHLMDKVEKVLPHRQ